MIKSVLYVARLDLSAPEAHGISKKIRAEARAFSNLLNADVTLLTPEADRLKAEHVTAGNEAHSTRQWSKRFLHLWAFYRELGVFFRNPPGSALSTMNIGAVPDVLYIRYQRVSPVMLWALRQAKAKHPSLLVFLEIPDWRPDENPKTLKQKVFVKSDRFFRKRMKGLVDRIVTVTSHTEILNIPAIPIQNGIDVNTITTRFDDAEMNSDAPVRLLGLANLTYWHGYDRIISGLAKSRERLAGKVFFEIVGDGQERQPLESLARRHNLLDGPDAMVRFHGSLSGEPLQAVVDQCDIGIASLGRHRSAGWTANDLKSREFCAKGLPFVYSYTDPDFAERFPYALRIGADDDPADIDAVLNFFETLRTDRPAFREEMTDFARRNLTWETKLAPVVEQMKHLRDKAGQTTP